MTTSCAAAALSGKKKVLILTITAGNGHNACAKTMKEALTARGAEVKVIDYLQEFAPKSVAWKTDRGFALVLAHFLKLYNASCRRMEIRKTDLRFKSGYMQSVALSGLEPLLKEIYTFRPDVIFCSNIYPSMAITDLRMSVPIPAKVYLTLLDYTINMGHESSIGVDYFNLTNRDFVTESLRIGYRKEQLLCCGIPIDPKFHVPVSREEARERLGIRKGPFTVLVMFGGGLWNGGYQIFRQTARALEGTGAQIVVINGKNKQEQDKIDRLLSDGTYRGLPVVNVGFTDRVDLYLAAADAIVTKVGGLSSTECVARQVPIVAARKKLVINEEWNADYLEKKGALLSFRNRKQLRDLLKKLMEDTAFYESICAAQAALTNKGGGGFACRTHSRAAGRRLPRYHARVEGSEKTCRRRGQGGVSQGTREEITDGSSAQTPLVSVILPVYNAEKYLRTCVGSILAQTYRNIELIMINDGSKDGSLAICRELETTDPRIRVFDKPNGGCSTARNMGIEQARGELLTFIDPDDFMLPDHIAALVEASDGVDMGIVGFLRTKPKAAYRQLTDKDRAKAQKRRTVFGMKEFMRGMLAFPTYGGGVVWNKLFRKSLIGELRFDENCFYFDDLNFLFKYGLRCRSFCCLPLKTYMYVVNPNSNSAKNISPRKLTCLDGMQEVAELAAETDEDIAVYARSWQFLINIEVTWLMHVNRYKDDALRARIMQTMQKTYPDFKKNKHNYHSYRRLGGLAYRLIRLFRY